MLLVRTVSGLSYVPLASGVTLVTSPCVKVRQSSGIRFEDPSDAQHADWTQMVLADVRLSLTPESLSSTGFTGIVSESFFFILPISSAWSFPSDSQPQERLVNSSSTVYRIGCAIPEALGSPPRTPPVAYLQSLIDKFGPICLSSDSSVNLHPIQITEAIWSTRFRNRAAIASQFFTRFTVPDEMHNGDANNLTSGVVFLIGDAAHCHSPGAMLRSSLASCYMPWRLCCKQLGVRE